MDLHVNFTEKIGSIKPLHGIGNAPLLGTSDSLFHYLGEAGIPYSRLHDTGGRFGGGCFVDINKSVKKGDILCVLEAMKMFNEVKSPIDGIVKCINFKDEDLVSVGDILFEIEEV